MRKFGLLFFAAILLLPSIAISQNGLIGSGFGTNDWATTDDFAGSAGDSRIGTFTATGTGNQYFRLVTNWSENYNQWGPSSSTEDYLVSIETVIPSDQIIENNTTKAYYINVSNNTFNYVFKTKEAGNPPANKGLIVFEVQGTVRSVSSVSKDKTTIYRGQTATITATLDGAFSIGQGVYLRYSNDGFSTSTITEMSGSGTSYTADIPSGMNTAGANIVYYVFTSGDGLTISSANADWYTINLNNSSGSNYSYTVNSSFITKADGNWGTASSWADVVPSDNASVVIAHDITLDQNATVSKIIINSGSTLTASDATARILTITKSTAGDEATFVNNGTWANGTGGSTVVFTGSPGSGDARHQISGTNAFQNITVNKTGGSSNVGASFGSGSTVSGTLSIGAGGFISTAPPSNFYGTDATLEFNQGAGANFNVNSGGFTWSTSEIPNNITITSGKVTLTDARSYKGLLLIQSGAEIVTNGNLTLESDASGTASLITNGTVAGNITVERYLAQDLYHYICSPINYSSGTFDDLSMGLASGDDFRRYETSSNLWIDILNGAGAGTLMDDETFDQGKGYAIAYASENKTLSLTGMPNNGDINVAVSSGGVGNNAGFNLIGNPYPSTLQASAFLAANNSTNGTINQTIGGTLFFWDEPASEPFEKGDYASKTISSSNPGGGSKTPTDYIDPGQGFFVSASANQNVTFKNDQRVHGTSVFFKSDTEIMDFKLQVLNLQTNDRNTITVVFDENSTSGFDALYDAPKWQGNPDLALYSFIGNSKFAINSLPELDKPTMISLGIYAGKSGNYKFSVHTLENFEPGTPITLQDRLTGEQTDLTLNSEYNFTIEEAGAIDDRFVLYFKSAVGISENRIASEPKVRIQNNQLTISNLEEGNVKVRLMDVMGRVLQQKSFENNMLVSFPVVVKTGVYVLEISTKNNMFASKVFIQ